SERAERLSFSHLLAETLQTLQAHGDFSVGFFIVRAALAPIPILAHDLETDVQVSIPSGLVQIKEISMFRVRFAALAVVAVGVGFVCGCLSLSSHPLFHGRTAACPETGCCDIGAVPDCEVPLRGSCCPLPGPVGNPGVLPPPNMPPANLAPQYTVPPLSQVPGGDRLVPTPSPRSPYIPQ